MSTKSKISWIVLTILFLVLGYNWITLANDNSALRSVNAQAQQRLDQAFVTMLNQTSFEDYAQLLDQLSTSNPEEILPKLNQVTDKTNQMCDRLYTLQQLQESIQPVSPWTTAPPDPNGDYLKNDFKARLFPVVYWIQKSHELQHRDIQPEDKQLFADIAKQIHAYDQKLAALQQMTQNTSNSTYIKTNFLQMTQQTNNEIITLLQNYEIQNKFPSHV